MKIQHANIPIESRTLKTKKDIVSNHDSKRMVEDNAQVKHSAVAVPVSKEADETSRNTCERINGDGE
jgi:V8-like Glu-specific endopeptidase